MRRLPHAIGERRPIKPVEALRADQVLYQDFERRPSLVVDQAKRASALAVDGENRPVEIDGVARLFLFLLF